MKHRETITHQIMKKRKDTKEETKRKQKNHNFIFCKLKNLHLNK